jgi:hypothetical protein
VHAWDVGDLCGLRERDSDDNDMADHLASAPPFIHIVFYAAVGGDQHSSRTCLRRRLCLQSSPSILFNKI